MNIQFSVILNSYERDSRTNDLRKCLKCLFRQSYKPKEIILVNSGYRKLKLKFKKKQNVKIINLKKKTLISEARNFGVKKAKYNYLAFIDDDDLWGKNYLKLTKKFILKENANIVLSTVYSTINKKKILFRQPFSNNLEDYFNNNAGAMGSNLVIQKKIFDNVKGYDKKLIVGEDKGIIMDLIIKKKKIYFQQNYVWYNLDTYKSITKQPKKMRDGLCAFLKKYYKYMKLSNVIFIKKKIHSYNKKLNPIFFIHFIFYNTLERLIKR
jgi:glycosyltransferase involved in cell wall biosynthesis